MFSLTPLLSGWTLTAEQLPEHMIASEKTTAFILPGADALSDFSDLLGFDSEEERPCESPQETASFSLPAMFPSEIAGWAELSREIDFGALCAQRAVLEIDQLCGSGTISLDGETLLSFGPGAADLSLDLTDALHLSRRQTLTLRFDDAKNAGVPGMIALRATDAAYLRDVQLAPDFTRKTLKATIAFSADRPGLYAIRAACVPDNEYPDMPWRESFVQVRQPGSAQATLSFSMDAPRFEPGTPYDAPLLKIELRTLHGSDNRLSHLCDARSMMTGRPAAAPRAYIPLTKEECRLDPDALIARAKAANITALFLPAPVSSLTYCRCALNGIALLPYAPQDVKLSSTAQSSPCAFAMKTAELEALRAPSAAFACAQLCSVMSSPLPLGNALSDEDLLWDAAGQRIDPTLPKTQTTLKALRALFIRLRAESIRRGQACGVLCAPGEWQEDAVFDALSCAFAPLHLSALPLRGAWWAQSRFSASLHAFIPKEEQTGVYTARAQLLDSEGHILADFAADCPVTGGPVGVMDALLPDDACVLTLKTELLRSGAVVRRSEIPVYVGLRGPLEAAFI